MGLLSASLALTRYKVDGQINSPVIETVRQLLNQHKIAEIDQEDQEKAVGWTSVQHPYDPNFDGSLFVMGTYFVFSLRIDKKSIPAKVIKKHCLMEESRKMKQDRRDYLSRGEKKLIKEQVIAVLNQRIPATPNIYDLIWDHEKQILYFFSNVKSANEELENLFSKTFKINLIRLFPYSIADRYINMDAANMDLLSKLTPSKFF